jgi:hypothetical protein
MRPSPALFAWRLDAHALIAPHMCTTLAVHCVSKASEACRGAVLHPAGTLRAAGAAGGDMRLTEAAGDTGPGGNDSSLGGMWCGACQGACTDGWGPSGIAAPCGAAVVCWWL